MKKFLAIFMILCLVAAMFVACGEGTEKETDQSAEEGNEEVSYTLGIGAAVSNSDLKTSTTTAAVVLDAEGKVVACRIDAVDVKPAIEEDGTVTIDAEYPTKAEKGDAYGMLSDYGSSLAEWYTQAQYFETAVIGKTADEVADINTGDAELVAGCTIDVADFVKAVVNACKSEHKVEFKTAADITVGVALNAGAKDDEDSIKYTADLAATVIADGKVVAAVIDSLEAVLTIVEGEADEFTYTATKLEQGDSYGMLSDYGSSLAEWYVQAQTYADTAVGKAPADVANLATEGVAGCTIYVGGYQKALAKAASYVR